jgi:tRNA dimethylallyltransferase
MGMTKRLRLILGPTGVGKTAWSITLAKSLACPIISCDSRQIYQEMHIGTAAPSLDEQQGVLHYFIGSHSIHQHYTAGQYELEALALIEKLFKEHDELLVVGGSGLYIDALCRGIDNFPATDLSLRRQLTARMEAEGIEALRFELKRLDPESYEEIDIRNPQRVLRAVEVCLQTGRPFSSFKTRRSKTRNFEIEKQGLLREMSELYIRIDARVDEMVAQGLEEEARGLWPHKQLPALRTVGYREWFDYFEGKTGREEAIALIKRNSRRYAKRQCSYWRRDESIVWQKM